MSDKVLTAAALAVVAVGSLNAVAETRKASELMLLEPQSFLGKFQHGAAKRVVRQIETAVSAERAAERLSVLPTEDVVKSVHRDDEDAVSATKAGIVVKAETIAQFTVASLNAEDKAKFYLRQASLARHLRTEADFAYLDSVSPEETAALASLRQRRRKAVEMPRKERATEIALILGDYDSLRKSIIARLAASPDATDAALAS